MTSPEQTCLSMTERKSIEDEYAAARPRSKALHERALSIFPSGVSHDGRFFTPFPFFVERAEGARKWDVDGHAYIDGWSGHGALILGHNHPAIVEAIKRQAGRGLHYSACHEMELTWAELVRECVPNAERVRFTTTGTETTALALRVARAHTGRTKVIKFQGHFHGIHDYGAPAVKYPFAAPMSAGVPSETLTTTLVARHNDLDHVGRLMEANDVAAVILEPAGAHSAVAPPDRDFLVKLRALTEERRVVLIFDEVVSGFRLAPGGAQEYFGVSSDLTCLAKAVAGGLPGAALVGRAEIMDSMSFTGDFARDRMKRVADQGTYSATPLVAAAGIATLEILKTGEVQRRLNALGDRLRERFNAVLEARHVPGTVYGTSSIVRFFLGKTAEELGLKNRTYDHEALDRGMGPLAAKLHLAMLVNGVDYNRGLGVAWLNGAMTDTDVDAMAEAWERSLVRLREEKLV